MRMDSKSSYADKEARVQHVIKEVWMFIFSFLINETDVIQKLLTKNKTIR